MEYISTALLFYEEYRSNFWKGAPLSYKTSESISDLDDNVFVTSHFLCQSQTHAKQQHCLVSFVRDKIIEPKPENSCQMLFN